MRAKTDATSRHEGRICVNRFRKDKDFGWTQLEVSGGGAEAYCNNRINRRQCYFSNL